MLLNHLFVEGAGPFKNLHLDLRGPDGHASCGPHILAGVNGSGKSTVLKSIAWCLTGKSDGFPFDEWAHFLRAHPHSRAMVVFDLFKYVWAITTDYSEGWEARLGDWVSEKLVSVGLEPSRYPFKQGLELKATEDEDDPYDSVFRIRTRQSERRRSIPTFGTARFGGSQALKGGYNAAAYSTARSMKFVEHLDMALPREKIRAKRFAFESTVQNEAIQSWLLALYSKSAIAKERHESSSRYTASFDALETGLKHICGEDVSIVVDIEPSFQPRLRIGNQTLNFSQIPDGVRTTVGWLADFMMRSDAIDWHSEIADVKPGLLLFDEVEGYLHPLWQRRVLPALREALPNTQSVVTSHSPFVISSCPQSIVHVLKLNSDGSAFVEPPVAAPIGESITSTLKEIFGVDSRFDIQTEKELAEWNLLNRSYLEHKLGPKERVRLRELSHILAARSEQLRLIVEPIPKLPKSAVDELTKPPITHPRRRRVASSR